MLDLEQVSVMIAEIQFHPYQFVPQVSIHFRNWARSNLEKYQLLLSLVIVDENDLALDHGDAARLIYSKLGYTVALN